jgi:hypothetical protein
VCSLSRLPYRAGLPSVTVRSLVSAAWHSDIRDMDARRDDNSKPWELPGEVLETIVSLLVPTHRRVTRHVSRDFRAAVVAVEEAGGGPPGLGLPGRGSFRLHASSLCASLDLMKWAREQPSCPWSPEEWMAKAAGEVI